jgi:voltage-gated potassium channel
MMLPAWVAIGAIGYRWIEGWTWFDALYMTVISLTTVGYREVHDLSTAGQTFTMVLCLGGIFTLFYATAAVFGYIVRGEVSDYFGSRRMERALAEMKDHVLVCGLGRMGRFVCQEFSSQKMPFVVIDSNAEALDGFKTPYGVPLHGDAGSDEILQRAGIARARCLITVVPSDAANLYITMSARLLNERLFIVARSEDESSEQKLLRAGASRVVSPYVIGGARVAQAVLRPNVVDFLELATRTEHMELNIEETVISPDSPLVEQTLENSGIRHEFGLIIVAIKQASGQMVFNPPRDTRLAPRDVLIMLGRREDLDRLSVSAGGSAK